MTFAPESAGSVTGSVSVTSNATNSPAAVSLSGAGSSSLDPLAAPICGLTNDSTNHMPDDTDWANFIPPAIGGTYTDSLYGCSVKRLTNSAAYGEALHHYYATEEPISAGDSYIMVVGESSGAWHIIDLNGNVVIPAASFPNNDHNDQPKWDRTADNVFWINLGNVLEKCTITGNSASCAANHTFAEYASYGQAFTAETDMTLNGWLPLVGQNTQGGNIDVFLYNPTASVKSPVYETSCTGDAFDASPGCIHKMISTANDGIMIQFASNGTCTECGNRLWESDTTPAWSITAPQFEATASHIDSGKDLSSTLVMASEDQPQRTTQLIAGAIPASSTC